MDEQEDMPRNWIYVINDKFRIIYTNDQLISLNNQKYIGEPCYYVIAKKESQCKKCPMRHENNGKTTVFNNLHNEWVNITDNLVEWPNAGKCHLISCEILEKEEQENIYKASGVAEYSELLELNYKNDTCHIIYSNRLSGKVDNITEYPISKMVQSVAEKTIKDEDRERFYEFWQFDHIGMEGIPKVLSAPHYVEIRQLKEDGTYSWAQLLLIPTEQSLTDSIHVMFFYNTIETPSISDKEDEDYGIYNRQKFFQRVSDIIKKDEGKTEWCMVAIDIEKFKLFNEWYGLEAGDELLSGISQCLKNIQSQNSVAGYFGDDDFAYFMECDEQLIQELYDIIQTQIKKHSGKMNVLPCFGINKITNVKEPLIQIYDRAKLACSAIKGNYIKRIKWFDLEMLQSLQSELLLLSDIQTAFKNHEFYFVIQPKCNTKSGKIVGGEALARWKNEDKGAISPAVFIPFLEKSGLVMELDKYIWESVCQWQRSMLDRNKCCIPVSVNISRMDIFLMDVPKHFEKLIQQYQLDPHLIELEITESVYAENVESISIMINELRHMGFKVLMDDFGSAYSSLNMLKDLAMDVIKMDMRFLQWEDDKASKGADILQTICNMAHMLGLDLIAEGVETEEQKNLLIKNGCENAQGYYFYRPLDVHVFEKEMMENLAVKSERIMEEPEELFYLNDLMDKHIINQDMINNMLGAVAFYDVMDNHIKLIRYNRKYVELLGNSNYSNEINFDENLYKDETEKIMKMFQEAQYNRYKGAVADIRRKNDDGSEMWVHLRVFFLYQRSGHAIFYSTVSDITQVYQTNKVLDFLNNDMPGGYFRHLNNTDGDFTHISQRFLDIFGYTREELKLQFHDKFINMIHPEDRKLVVYNIMAMKEMGGNNSQPCRMRSKNGYISVLVQSRLSHYDSNNEIIQGIVFCNLDHYMWLRDDCQYMEDESIATALMPCGVYQSEVDGNHQFSYISNSMLHLLGYSREKFEEKFKNNTDNLVYIEDFERVNKEVSEQIQYRNFVSSDFRIELADGSLKWVYCIARLATDLQGKRWFYSCVTDYDYLKEKYEVQEWQLQKYKSLVEIPGTIVYDYNPENDCLTLEITTENGGKETIVAEKYLMNIETHGFISKEDVDEQRQELMNAINKPHQGVTEFRAHFLGNQEYRWYRFHYTSLADKRGNVYRVVGRGEDISFEKSNLASLQLKSMNDSLTGLLNFESFRKIVNNLIDYKKKGIIILIDIDQFKQINDRHGLLIGDEVLIKLTKFLKSFFSNEYFLARFGGDEFLVCIPGIMNKVILTSKIEELLSQINQLKLFDEIKIQCSIGIAEIQNNLTFDDIFTRAEQALNQAKKNGKNTYSFFDESQEIDYKL